MVLENPKEILNKIKSSILKDNYQIENNKNRKDNYNFKRKYELGDKELKTILLGITEEDYYETVNNYKKGYEHERLHIFAPTINIEDSEEEINKVQLYIKFNIVKIKEKTDYVIVISLHEAKKPIKCKSSL